jgi:hypothetical protein
MGGRSTAGFGKFNYDGRTVEASRLVCAITYEPMVTALHARHIRPGCARDCCNPRHLYAATGQQNQDDRKLIPTPVVDPQINTSDLNSKVAKWIRKMQRQGVTDVTLLPRTRRLSTVEAKLINDRFARRFGA